MVRWRYCVMLAMLLLPTKTGSNDPSDAEATRWRGRHSGRQDEEEDEDDDDDDEEEEENNYAAQIVTVAWKPPIVTTPKAIMVMRTIEKQPLECYVCAFISLMEMPLRECLDPTEYRVHTITCHGAEDKCFTSVLSKGSSYEAVVRGCRSGCVGSSETTCCALNRCNNQAFAKPIIVPRSLTTDNQSNKSIPPKTLCNSTADPPDCGESSLSVN